MQRILKGLQRFSGQFWLCMMAILLFEIGQSSTWPYMALFIQKKLNVPLSAAAMSISVKPIFGVIASLFAGSITDRLGRKLIVCAAFLGLSVNFLLMRIVSTSWLVISLLALLGMLEVALPVGVNTMITDLTSPEELQQGYAIYKVFFNIGYSIGPVLGGYMAVRSYDSLFTLIALMFLAAWALLQAVLKESGKYRQQAASENVISGLLAVYRDKLYLRIIILLVFVYITTYSPFNLLSSYANKAGGFTEDLISIVFTVNAAAAAILQIPGTGLVKNRKPIKVLLLTTMIYGLSCIGFVFFSSIPWYCVCIIGYSIGEVFLHPAVMDISVRLAPPEAVGRYVSLNNLAAQLANALGIMILGFCFDTISPQSIWWVGSSFSLVTLFGLLVMMRRYSSEVRFQKIN